ncbi:MAG: MFS transporter [Planctomycetaceae bacterium]
MTRIAAYLATFPLIAVFCGALLGGYVIDLILKKTGSRFWSRCGVAIGSLAASGLFVIVASRFESLYLFTLMMSVCALFTGMGNPAAWTATMDVGGRQTAIAFGVMNMAGALRGFIMPIVLGYLIGDIKRTEGDWNHVLYVVALTYFVAALCWLLVNPNQTIDD